MLSKALENGKDHAMDANSTIIGTGFTRQTDLKNEGSPRNQARRIQPEPTITPEKIGCVMADVEAQIHELQLYLIELAQARTRVTLHGEKGWGRGEHDPS
jgi:hypothetical protein